jgi:hypothetical protein
MPCAIATDSSTLTINLMMLIGPDAVPDRAAVRAMRAVRTPALFSLLVALGRVVLAVLVLVCGGHEP